MTEPAPSLTKVAFRTQRWFRQRPVFVDMGVVVLVAILSLAELFNPDSNIGWRDADVLAVVLVTAGALTLFWRRTHPILMLAIATTIISMSYMRGYGTYLSALGFTAFYSVTAHAENRRRAWTAISLAIGAVLAVGSFTVIDGPAGYRWGDATGVLLWITTVAVAGAVVRNRHELFLGTKARAQQAEAAAERAAANERLRIAREMHDVVTHGVGIMAVQAAAARETLDVQPERTRDLLLNIESTARESLVEMRRMLGVLRNGDDADTSEPSSLAPQPSLDDLDKLVSSSIEAGTPTELVVSGNPRPLSAGTELAAFRLVQEALTNVQKHGGAAATVEVELRYSPDDLDVTITDTGRGADAGPPTSGSGNGLVGMRERVDAYGGQLSAGPRLDGGYQIKARLPTDPPKNRHHRTEPSTARTSP